MPCSTLRPGPQASSSLCFNGPGFMLCNLQIQGCDRALVPDVSGGGEGLAWLCKLQELHHGVWGLSVYALQNVKCKVVNRLV